jgi:hypothetical protein
MGVIPAFDATSADYGALPPGQRCAYVTGTPDILWSTAELVANPGVVLIAQAVGLAVDESPFPDILDVEGGAATYADCGPWAIAMQAAFATNKRPGQRRPAIYCSASNVSNVVNALVAAGVTSGVGLWIANWNLTDAQAVVEVLTASGPFPIIAIQFSDLGGGGSYDLDVFSTSWLADQSGVAGNLVSQGSSGPAVRAAQEALNTWYPGRLVVDGLFGEGTLAATEAFQTLKKLTVDGVIGSATWKALEPSAPDPVPVPTPSSAPGGLKQTVRSTASEAIFSWQPVAGVTLAEGYHLQVEWDKSGFGWVLSIDETVKALTQIAALAPRTTYRWRVAANTTDHVWSSWVQFVTT